MTTYEVWVVSEKTKQWERYTAVPFTNRKKAVSWVKRYIPNATSKVWPSEPETG